MMPETTEYLDNGLLVETYAIDDDLIVYDEVTWTPEPGQDQFQATVKDIEVHDPDGTSKTVEILAWPKVQSEDGHVHVQILLHDDNQWPANRLVLGNEIRPL